MIDPNHLDEESDLVAFTTIHKSHSFALVFAVFHHPGAVATTLDQFGDVGVQQVVLDSPIESVIDELRNHPELDVARPIWITGFERWVEKSENPAKVGWLKSLNASRGALAREYPTPLVFWVPDFLLNEIHHSAPDLFSVNSGVFDFGKIQAVGEMVDNVKSRVGGQYSELGTLEYQDRIPELEATIKELRALPADKQAPDSLPYMLDRLGTIYQSSGNYAKAEPYLREALEIRTKVFGPESPSTVVSLNNLAQLLQATNRLAEAEPIMRRALEIDTKSFGEDHPNVAIRLNNLAQLLQDKNRLAEAEPIMRQALEIDTKSFGEDHPNVAIDLNNLAQLLKATNRLAEAEPIMRRALEIDTKSFGEDHPKVAIRLNNLAQLLQATNRLAEAEPIMRRALEIDTKSFGEDHPKVAIRLNNLASLLKATNRLAEAEPIIRRALEIFQKSLGSEHPNTKVVLGNYRLSLEEMGMSKTAIKAKLDSLSAE